MTTTLISLNYTPQEQTGHNFQIARTILSQIPTMAKLRLGLRDYKLTDKGVIFTIGVRGTTVRGRVVLNEGKDLYEVSVGRQDRKTREYRWLYNAEDVFFDQLTQIIAYGFEQVAA